MFTVLVSTIVTTLMVVSVHGKKSSYDFIVVGAGSAGSVVASELASNFPDKDVLLIEEGYYSKINPCIDDMKCYPDIAEDPTISRLYKTTPQTNLDDRELDIGRAKVTGGCNAHNGQVYIWAHEKDFERWGNIEGWTLDDLLPLWDELEEQTFHGFTSTLGDAWMERVTDAGESLGYEWNENWNDLKDGKSQEGVTYLVKEEMYMNDSYIQRRSSWTDYLEPVLLYTNLDIMVFARVNKIILNNNNDKAIGVEIQNIGTLKKESIYVKNEIVLSASVFDSPKILLSSGIGDCDELSNVNIECKVDLPGVGKGLQDHIITVVTSPPVLNTSFLLSQLPSYYWNSLLLGAGLVTENGDHHWHIFFEELTGDDGETLYALSILVINNRMTSQGSVSLLDDNPESLPVIDFKYLDVDSDIELVIKSLKQAREFLYDTGAFDDVFESEENEILPGYHLQSDEEIENYLRSEAIGSLFPGAHTGGTCKMSDDDSDSYGVVNERLQVKGVQQLRVADCSVMPTVVSANTNQMAMMIGLKAAKMIIQDYCD